MILDEIVINKRQELASSMKETPLQKIKELAERMPPALDLPDAIKGETVKLIAEVKKASPSRGLIRENFDPVEIAAKYTRHNVAAISVITESKYFQGDLAYLQAISSRLGEKRPPLIRKDFIFDPYQVYEARAYGADSLLLIAAILDAGLMRDMLFLARHLGMECLVEIHDEDDLRKAMDCGARIIGINNRDLRTFKVDISVTHHLRPLIPQGKLVVSESGIKSITHMSMMQQLKINAVLIGEALMAAADIGRKIRELTL